jgi:hypothetical protein
VDSRQWAVGSGQWAVISGQWAVGSGQSGGDESGGNIHHSPSLFSYL